MATINAGTPLRCSSAVQATNYSAMAMVTTLFFMWVFCAVLNAQASANLAAEQDHDNMQAQLGITRLRPGPSGDEHASNHANFDEAKAGPDSAIPDALVLRDGTPVTKSAQWWKLRRPQIVEDFAREVYGRVPATVPEMMWTVISTEHKLYAGHPAVVRELRGRVTNPLEPSLSVELRMTEVVPADSHPQVPMLIMFGKPGSAAALLADSPQERMLAVGWGFATLDPTSIQADNGAGLRQGIIGLVNRGRPRKPDDWGALRAWAWGAGKALEFLQTDPSVNPGEIGIEGVSRYGKAALVTLAFDQRFRFGLIGSSGEGGAKLHRRNFGEAVESLGGGEYYWMAGNFMKYSAAESTFGPRTAADLPVDANELIALCAPRLTFISYGSPEHGDARWLDQRGSFMAAVAAQPVFRLLGVKDMGVSDDYVRAQLPPVETGLLDGHLAWRQHNGGHTDAPNFPSFLTWASSHFAHEPYVAVLDAALEDLIAPGTLPIKLASGYKFTEGPMWRQGRLWFVDVVGDTVNAVAPDGRTEVLVEHAGGFPNKPPQSYNGPDAMVPDKDGTVLMAQQGGRKLVRITREHKLVPFLNDFQGRRFNSPNDLVFAPDGALWFTDPPYGLAKGDSDPAKELSFNAVFRYAHGKLEPVIKDLTLPNGIAFSPDGRTLYVANSGPRERVMQYQVGRNGKVSAGRPFMEFPEPHGLGVPDGLKVDSIGNVWLTGPGGVRIVSPQGKVLGQIVLPETAANLAWGGDGHTVFITAQTGVYSLSTLVRGQQPLYARERAAGRSLPKTRTHGSASGDN